ncbi:MAG: stage II sporulation protein R [Lachnospiraceae bacterium]|nr:stage II sporulation protein R [Lachnospiraceae bacterium]
MNKKLLLFILCLLTCFFYLHNSNDKFLFFNNNHNYNSITTASSNLHNNQLQKSISNKIIRFHVIGNSDSYIDQDIKIKIKNTIVETYSPLFQNVNNINVARKLIRKNLDNITATAQDVLSNHGISYSVNTKLSTRTFPIKQYGNIILPAGQYEAVSIELGHAKGRNWWCVLYPSLCFIKNTNNTLPSHGNNPFKNILTSSEYSQILYEPSTKVTYTSFLSTLFF